MAIRNRRGVASDLVVSKLLPGEFAICTDGTIVICYAAGKTAKLASVADIQRLEQQQEEYKEEINQIISEIRNDLSELARDLNETFAKELSDLKLEIENNISKKLSEVQKDVDELKEGAGKYPIASEQEAISGEANDKLMSPLRTAQAIDKKTEEIIDARDVEKDLGTRLDKIESGERMTGAGKLPLATEAEARAGIDDNKLMTPLKVAQAIESLATGGGGGGGGATIPIMSSTFTGGSFAVGEEIEIRYRWSSPNEGYGILHVFVNNVEIITEEVLQGLNRVAIPGQEKGNYTVLMYVTDRGGLTTDKLSFQLKVGGLDITSTFDDSEDFTIKSVIRIPVTIDTISLDPIYITYTIDKASTRIAGQNGYNIVQLPAMTPGAHKVTISAESGVYRSATLTFNIVIEDADTLTIITDFDTEQVSYRDLVEIPYRVSLKGVSKFNAEYLVDGTVVKTLVISAGNNVWSTRDLEVGDHTLQINVATQDGAKTAYVEKRLRVNAGSYTPLQPVQDASLLCWLDATGRTNDDADREVWPDKSGNGTAARLIDFNYGNNGWMDGTLKCNGGSYVEIDLQALKDNIPYGLTVEVKFATRDTGEQDACVMDMRGSDANGKGFAVDTQNMYLNSGSTKLKSAVLENEISRATFVIDRQNRLAYIYNNAVMTEAFIMTGNEDFYNTSKIYLNTTLRIDGGAFKPALFGDCEIYSVRVYERALSSEEIVQNHIADIQDLAEQEDRYRMNYDNMMPTMYFYGDTSAMTKDYKVPLRIKYISTDSNKYGESFDLVNCPVGWQGTSSLQYAVKNYKIKLVNQDGSKFKYNPFPTGYPESTFTLKADYMESSHANNTGMCKYINDKLYVDKTPPQQADAQKRTAINGFPIQLYIARDEQSTPVYMGVFNFNLDKGCFNNLGLDNTVEGWENCTRFEVSSNSDTSAGAFKDDSDKSMREDFELNYPDPDDYPEAEEGAYLRLKRVVSWVKNCTEETFRSEVDQYFNKDFLLKYYLQVHLFGMVDNLGKNMMLATWDGNIWYPMFYDADSQLALDNTGYLKFYSDIDIVAGTYNTSGSKLWTMVSKVFADELADMYKSMRQTVYKLDVIMQYWYGEQVAKIGEKQYNADMEAKYIQFKSDYLFMLHGRRYENTKRWLTERLLYLDTIYGYEEDTRQSITIRANKSGSVFLDIDTYSPQYVRVVWRNGVEQKLKVGRDANGNMVSKRFSSTLATATDQEVVIYNARHIKKINNLSGLSPSVLNFVEAEKLTEIVCRNASNLTDMRISSNNKFLRKIDVTGCSKLGTASGGGNTLDLAEITNIRELFTMDTKYENIIFGDQGSNYTTITYPSTLKILDLRNMPLLSGVWSVSSTYGIEGSFTVFRIVNCPKLSASKIRDSIILAENVHIENSFSGTRKALKIGDGKIQPVSVVIKGAEELVQKRLIVVGQYSSKVPAVTKLELDLKVEELVLTKVGMTEETTLDLSMCENISVVLEECANISELILPETVKGLALLESSLKYISGYVGFPDELQKCNPYIKGKNNSDIVDFSQTVMTDYFRIDYETVRDEKPLKINVDFSQKRPDTYIDHTVGISGGEPYQSFFKIPNNTIGKVKYGRDAVLGFRGGNSRITDEQMENIVMDTSESTNFRYMFKACTNLTTIPQLDTSKGTNFENMFNGCTNLTTVPQLDVRNGINFSYMFYYCGNLMVIPQLDVRNGTDFNSMFCNCRKITKLPFMDTSKGKNISIFCHTCSNLQEVEGVDLSSATNALNMFLGTMIKKIKVNGTVGRLVGEFTRYLSRIDSDSIDSIIVALLDYTGQSSAALICSTELIGRMSDEQKAAITAKNWTITVA